uniref:OCRE domain-containing protein n=1 Tax=Meloidogyne hapla TaxID=6305 RepID=A0A1I8BZN5_MELHA
MEQVRALTAALKKVIAIHKMKANILMLKNDQETSDTSSQAQVWDHSGWIPENRGSFSGNGDYHPHPQGNTNMYDPTHLNNVNDKDETSTSTQQRRSRKSCGRKNEQLQNTKGIIQGENNLGHKSNYGGKYHHNTNLDGFDASDVIPNNVLYPQYYSDGYTIYGYCDNYGNLYDKYRNFYGYYDNYGNFIQMKM